MIYGATGFTGALVVDELARLGAPPPVIAGRRLDATAWPGREVRAFALDDAGAIARGLAGVRVVLNTAGPFTRTARPLATACAAAGVHYLDLAGEVAEHEAVAALDPRARSSGAMLLPGAGFGCVPTEVAAVEAVRRLGEPPRELTIAYDAQGGASRGTLESVLRDIHLAGVQRRDGALVAARPGREQRRVELGGGRARAVTNPWRADLIAAYTSTRAPTISTLATFPASARTLMRWPGLAASRLGRWVVDRTIANAPRGPAAAALQRGRTRIWIEARGATARSELRLHGPDAYVVTARVAARLALAALAGRHRPGYAVPSQIFAWSELLAVPGVAEAAA